jgi:hypothetical protein
MTSKVGKFDCKESRGMTTKSITFTAGSAVLVAFQDPATLNKKRVRFSQVYDEPLSVWMKELSEFTKRYVQLVAVPFDTIKQEQPYLAEIFGSQQEFGYYAGEESHDIIEASSIVSKPFKSWGAWLEGSKWAGNLKLEWAFFIQWQ